MVQATPARPTHVAASTSARRCRRELGWSATIASVTAIAGIAAIAAVARGIRSPIASGICGITLIERAAIKRSCARIARSA
jgi:hypothetical protein